MWELYAFDMVHLPYIKTVRYRWQVRLWMWRNSFRIAELRAINTITKEHIVR